MKRGQAAMEFLMTYGWVLLVVLVAVSALAYFGVLNPGDKLPESCVFFPGIGCNDFKVTSSSVILVITNGGGINLEDVTFTVLGTGPCSGDTSETANLNDGESKTYTISCSDIMNSGSAFRREIQMDYTELNGLNHSKKGQIHTKVE
jgi:hypothetical protein